MCVLFVRKHEFRHHALLAMAKTPAVYPKPLRCCIGGGGPNLEVTKAKHNKSQLIAGYRLSAILVVIQDN